MSSTLAGETLALSHTVAEVGWLQAMCCDNCFLTVASTANFSLNKVSTMSKGSKDGFSTKFKFIDQKLCFLILVMVSKGSLSLKSFIFLSFFF